MLLNAVSGKKTRSSEWYMIDEISIFLIDSDVSFQFRNLLVSKNYRKNRCGCRSGMNRKLGSCGTVTQKR